MEDNRTKDLIRYTLHTFVGKSIKNIEINENQKKGIDILTGFTDEKFEHLCVDLINEIRRRNGLSYDTPSLLGSKLINMDEHKFKSLVIETLVVFYIKNSQYELEDMPQLLEKMQNFVSIMKKQTERDVFLGQIKKLPFYDKMQEFIEFAQRKGVGSDISSAFKQLVNEEIEKGGIELINTFSYPELFINILKKSEVYRNSIEQNTTEAEQLENLNSRIQEAILFKDMNLETRSQLLRECMKSALCIVIENLSYPTKKIEYFDQEIQQVINILESIEQEISKSQLVDLDQLSVDIHKILASIIEKGSNLSTERVSELKIQQVSVEMMSNTLSRNESFKLVLDIAKDIRKALASV